jgi:hypothetical protein
MTGRQPTGCTIVHLGHRVREAEPRIAQAPARVLLMPLTHGGLNCPACNPCSAGWYVVGGTSSSTPQWAGLVALADQIAGHGLGLINPALYALASGPHYGRYSA